MIPINTETFLGDYRQSGAPLSGVAEQGLRELISYLSADTEVTDVRWAAYMLATVRHECADRWLPIEEFGHGRGRPYGQPVGSHIYYGRGYVQLTWCQNYSKMGQVLGVGSLLVDDPGQALDSRIAYRIMSTGMRQGLFTGKKLADYIQGDRCEYHGARRIINGMDRADLIARYALQLEELLRRGLQA